jgi:dTMP kinase
VVFEGGEGCGKTTQARLLAERWDAVLTRQPGGTPLGARLRELLLAPPADPDAPDEVTGSIADRAEALLMAADRAQHVAELVEPALAAGRDVVCDRYIGSSVAYQGYGRGLGAEPVRDVSEWAVAGLWPDLVVLLDVDPATARARIGRARDRIEAEGADFHDRVRTGFLDQAAAAPDRWVVVDGGGTPDEVAAGVRAALAARWPDRP